MLQSTSNLLQDIPATQTHQTSFNLPTEHQKTEHLHTSLDQLKMVIENDKKIWNITEFTEWLSFIVRYSINSPYQDVQNVIMCSKNGDKIYEDLSKIIFTKNSKQCFRFSRKMVKEMRNRTDQGLLNWCIKKLRKQVQNPKIEDVLSKYESFCQQRSPYMKILDKMNQFYSKQELQLYLN